MSSANSSGLRSATVGANARMSASMLARFCAVGVMTSPVIPGLNDQEIPALLEAAKEAGAGSAGYILLRLPLAVRPIFEAHCLKCHGPSKREGGLDLRQAASLLAGGDSGPAVVAGKPKVLILRMRSVPAIDATACMR